MEVESFEDGVLLRRLVAEGDTVPVNTICAYVGDVGEEIPAEAPAAVPSPAPPAPVPDPAVAPVPATPPAISVASAFAAPSSSGAANPGESRVRISPRASRAAAEAGHRPPQHRGHRSRRDGSPSATCERPSRRRPAPCRSSRRMPRQPPVPRVAPAPAAAPAPAIPADGEEAPRPLSRIRRVIADRLTHSWTSTPHFTVTVAVDVTALLALRAELKAGGTNLTVTDFVLAATAQTLAEFPDVNSRTDGVSVWPRRRVHLGLAVSLPGGLVVPVIRDADRLPIAELHDRAAALAAKAREGALAVDDMTGSTFTVSNLGMFGVEEFSAIINPGEAAILAVASAIPTAGRHRGRPGGALDHEADPLRGPSAGRWRARGPVPGCDPAPPRGFHGLSPGGPQRLTRAPGG